MCGMKVSEDQKERLTDVFPNNGKEKSGKKRKDNYNNRE